MGNSESKSDTPKSPATSTPQSKSRRERDKEGSQNRAGANGGQSVSSGSKQPHSHVTKTHTPPTASLVPSCSTPSTSTSNTHAQATVSNSPASSHSRARSITTSAPKARADQSTSSHRSSPMGNEQSRHRPPSRSSTLPPHSTEKPAPSPSSQPVDVPHPAHHDGFDEAPSIGSTQYGLPASEFSRPPRLPLPIDRDPEPTSPIVSPQDATQPEEQDMMPRRSSMLSSTTLDDDDGTADIEQFTIDPSAQKVTTTLEYRGDYKTVFVTGTFANWEKKFRMQKTQDKNGETLFTLTASLPVGTHHIRFLVDGDMVISDQYPTTVDFTNSLVNYVEIAPQTPTATATQPRAPAEPMPIPGADLSETPVGTAQPPTKSLGIRPRPSVTESEFVNSLEETIAPAPSIPEGPTQPISISSQTSQHQQQEGDEQSQDPNKPPKMLIPRAKYTSEIPDILLHLDLYNNPDDDRYRRASKAIQNLPQPPSLPMFMSKSILNAATPHKDDASVLTMPNHTVLNHLATSSIRNGVLATSGTTRYKRKVGIAIPCTDTELEANNCAVPNDHHVQANVRRPAASTLMTVQRSLLSGGENCDSCPGNFTIDFPSGWTKSNEFM